MISETPIVLSLGAQKINDYLHSFLDYCCLPFRLSLKRNDSTQERQCVYFYMQHCDTGLLAN